MDRNTIASLYADADALGGQTVTVAGWVRSIRDMKNFGFVTLNDGSCFKDLQVVVNRERLGDEVYDGVIAQSVGAALVFTGALELSSGVGAMAGLPLTPGSLALGEFLLSWGGLCVHGQAGAAAEGLKMRKRLGGKLLQGVFSAALAYAAASIIM